MSGVGWLVVCVCMCVYINNYIYCVCVCVCVCVRVCLFGCHGVRTAAYLHDDDSVAKYSQMLMQSTEDAIDCRPRDISNFSQG